LRPQPAGGLADLEATREDLAALMPDEPAYRTEQVWRALNLEGLRPHEMTVLPKPLRQRLEEALTATLSVAGEARSADGATLKWLFQLADGARVETVLMLYSERATVCVSSQAGCAMGCTFCATGQDGFRRHLSASEIYAQVLAAKRAAGARRLTNVVFMGMGEPLANFERLRVALRRIHDDLGISARHLTVSTVGVVPGIRRLGNEPLPVNLAVSLHAANDELRSRLVPANRRWPLGALMEACRVYAASKNRRISFEWALIRDVNDSPDDARQLADLALPLRAHVNLIPLNPTPGFGVAGSGPKALGRFQIELRRLGVNATVRSNRGLDIDAACGQLASRLGPKRPGPQSRLRVARVPADR